MHLPGTTPSEIRRTRRRTATDALARNPAIIEEGYLYAARYLKQLEPDLLMGSPSFVMSNPGDFISGLIS